MSMTIRHKLKGEPVFTSGNTDGLEVAAFPQSLDETQPSGMIAHTLAWVKQIAGLADVKLRRHAALDARRKTRSLFHSWAESDLAHRDVARQIWPASRP